MAKEKQEKELETGIKADGSIDVAVEQKEKNLVSDTSNNISSVSYTHLRAHETG